MNLPAEIVQYLTPENLQHLGNGLQHYFEAKVGGEIGARLFKASRRRLLPFLDRYDDIEIIKKRLDRLDDFVVGFESEHSRPAENDEFAKMNAEAVAGNVDDPGFDDFVSEACEIAMQSPDEAMRLLLGRVTALRSQTKTASFGALQIQEALTLTKRLSARQLWALTAVYMLTSAAMKPPKMAPRDIEAYLDREYYPVLAYLAQQPWNVYDLQYLTFLNAITFDQTYEMMEKSPESGFRRLFRAGGEYWPIPQGEPVQGRFLALADEFHSETGHQKRSIGPYRVTYVGAVLAGVVFEQLHDQLVADRPALNADSKRVENE